MGWALFDSLAVEHPSALRLGASQVVHILLHLILIITLNNKLNLPHTFTAIDHCHNYEPVEIVMYR